MTDRHVILIAITMMILPGMLTVTAYLLHANGIIPEQQEINASTLPSIKMPARQRFVPDNRTDTNHVR